MPCQAEVTCLREHVESISSSAKVQKQAEKIIQLCLRYELIFKTCTRLYLLKKVERHNQAEIKCSFLTIYKASGRHKITLVKYTSRSGDDEGGTETEKLRQREI